MALTNNQILEISEAVEKMYMDCTSQLLINLCSHFATDKALATAAWETKKLSELDALTNESIEIIAANTGKAPEVIKGSVAKALNIELTTVEKILNKAAKDGNIQGVRVSWQASESVKTVLKNLVEQAVHDTNIVNTVMLQSTRERYVNAVQFAAMEEARLIEQLQSANSIKTLNAQLAKTQQALNSSATSMAIGAEARSSALRRTIDQLAAQGITGYVDAAGHQWSPEAYINMDIRTTVHNAAIQGQKARSADYGVSTFQISSHSGARPLCAPYQGKFYSWDGSSGVVEDLNGRKYSYTGIQTTSYGQPAGIFGINCGHRPNTFISGYSLARFEPTENVAENNKQYQLTQKQRYLERQIRADKTKALAFDAAGDKEAFAKTAAKIKEKNAQYKAFCVDNNLTPRLERTQVVGYNRSVSSKATAAAKARAKEQATRTAAAQERQNYIKNIKPTLPKTNVPLANTSLRQTIAIDVQTKGKQDLHGVIPVQAELTNVRIIAGYGTSSNFRNAKGFAETYGGEDYKWEKIGGLIETDNFIYDVHWYQVDGESKHYVYQVKGVKEK